MGTIKALDGVTVNINKGDVMAVIGPSGSGKSTFLRSLNLLEEPTGGAIIFNGIDITKKKVSIDDEEVQLTKKEFEILLLLVQNKGRVFSREDILARIWSDEVYVLDRTIDVNITRLRKKIGEYGKCIVTRLGYGYCFEAE